MIFFERWLKDRLGNAESHNRVDADALWQRVAADLPKEPLAPPVVTPGSGTGRATTGLAIILLVAVAGFYLFLSAPTNFFPSTDPHPATPGLQSTATIAETPAGSATFSEDPHPIEQAPLANPPRTIKTPKTQAVANGPELEDRPATYTVSSSGPKHPSPGPLTPYNLNPLTPLPVVPVGPLPLAAPCLPVPVASKLVPPGRQRFGFTLSTGTHVSFPQFQTGSDDALATTLAGADGQLLGYSVHLEADYRFAPGWQLSAGVGWYATTNAFRHQSRYDTVIVVDGTPVDARALHTVSHNNRRRTIALPFTVMYGRPVGKFDLQLGIGCTLNFVGSQTGKTLDVDHQVIAYGNEVTQLPVRRLYLAYHLRPAVTYWATPRIGLQLRPELRYQRFGASPLWQHDYRSLDVGGSFGIVITPSF